MSCHWMLRGPVSMSVDCREQGLWEVKVEEGLSSVLGVFREDLLVRLSSLVWMTYEGEETIRSIILITVIQLLVVKHFVPNVLFDGICFICLSQHTPCYLIKGNGFAQLLSLCCISQHWAGVVFTSNLHGGVVNIDGILPPTLSLKGV